MTVEPPWPSRSDLQCWALDLAEQVDTGQVTADDLVELVAETRRAGRDSGALADWLLVLANDHGATLPPLATAWSATGNPRNVHGPDGKIKRLHDRHGDARNVLERFLLLPTPSPAGEPEPQPTVLTTDRIPSCLHAPTAESYAWELVREHVHQHTDAALWASPAQRLLRYYLLAAALADANAGDVGRWALDPSDPTPLETLRAHPEHVPEGWISALQQRDEPVTTRQARSRTVQNIIGSGGSTSDTTH